MHELTARLLQDPRTKKELIRKRAGIRRDPRFRGMRDALAQLPDDERLPDDEFSHLVEASPGLEKIVRAINRPALLIREDSFEVPIADVWNARLSAARASLERAIPAVGRIELREKSGHIGTGWLIAPGILVTNRHVGREFARRANGAGLVFRTTPFGRPLMPQVDFREEHGDRRAPLEFALAQVLYLAPDDDAEPDVALFRVRSDQGPQALPYPIPLASAELKPGQPVAAIGYPAYDYSELDRAAMVEMFGGIFDVKRLSPGEIMIPPMEGAWHLRHDCTTLGGSSGSVILDLETGGAVGLHFSGTSGEANYAVGVDALDRILKSIQAAPLRAHAVVAALRAEPLAGEEKATIADYEDREGYDPGFLGNGVSVPLPAPIAARQAEIARRIDTDGVELAYRHFSVVVNGARRFPMITGVNIDGRSLRRVPGKGRWRIDPRVAAEHQIGNEVYYDNNLDKGHMVRRLDPVWGTKKEATEANNDTFHYTNACPQDHTFNDEVWGDLEDHILDSAPDDEKLCVLTGPVLAEDDPVYRDVQIPRSFWKVVAWRKGKLKVAAFLLTQEEYLGNLEFNPYQFGTYQVTLAQVGELAGVDFGALLQADVLAAEEAVRPRLPIISVDEIRM